VSAFGVLLLLAPPVAEGRRTTQTSQNAQTSEGDYYTNVNGHRVRRPVRADRAPVGASAKCRDGSWSFSENRRGTCSHHGGVASWL